MVYMYIFVFGPTRRVQTEDQVKEPQGRVYAMSEQFSEGRMGKKTLPEHILAVCK